MPSSDHGLDEVYHWMNNGPDFKGVCRCGWGSGWLWDESTVLRRLADHIEHA